MIDPLLGRRRIAVVQLEGEGIQRGILSDPKGQFRKGCAYLTLPLQTDRRIGGPVLDDGSHPAAGVTVRALRRQA